MRVLVTNDDGIDAPGIAILEAVARELSDDVWVIAPAEEQSGAGHSLTLTAPLRVRKIEERRFAVQGTPTDCVVMAMTTLVEGKRPDLVLSGVNRGGNLAEDVTYSGTVSAAMEAALFGVKAIALSQATIKPGSGGWDHRASKGEDFFAAARVHAKPVIQSLLTVAWGERVLINVNFPPVAAAEVAGVRVTEQGFREMSGMGVEERLDPRGFRYYWYGMPREVGAPGHETDLKAMREAHISVTPLHLDLTHYATMDSLRQAFAR
jgi:5'-nucleotidase